MNCKQGALMQLKPQDVVVLLKLVRRSDGWTYRQLATELCLSVGEVHNSLDRAAHAQLFDAETRRPKVRALEEFLIHGVKYAFPAERGSITRGMPTSYAASPLNMQFASNEGDYPPVWADPEGEVRGYKLNPLYDIVPKVAKLDLKFYELLALVDAIRDGRARERKLAADHLHNLLGYDDE